VTVSISTHVLDTGRGEPASGVRVDLIQGSDVIASGETGADGRIAALAGDLAPGRYSLVFHPPSQFFTRVELEVELTDGHYHIPLLASPYGCTSYRGS
jgi:5-hydroxyisourate hydrolase